MKRLSWIAVGLLIGACSNNPPAEDRTAGVQWTKIGFDTYIADVTSPDGVPCVVYDGVRSGGIDCDFGDR